ncbi:MAG: penicillin-binding protein activator LpoB [Phycisphaerales bacterium JB043]
MTRELVMIAAGCCLLATSCATSRTVTRQDPSTVMDLHYRFDEDDARQTADAMIEDALSHPWLDSWVEDHDRLPVIVIGAIENQTSDYIDTELFTKQFERALLNSGRVRLVASEFQRETIRMERQEISQWARQDTRKQQHHEIGADLILIGRVGENAEVSRRGTSRLQYYQVNLELVNIESNEKLWIGERQIEKLMVDS